MSTKISGPVDLDLDDPEVVAQLVNSAAHYSKLSQSAKVDLTAAHCRALNQTSTDHVYYVSLRQNGKIRIGVRPRNGG